jgi:hypothetical protein
VGSRSASGLGGLDELEEHASAAALLPALATLVRSRGLEKVDSIGFVVRRCIQYSARSRSTALRWVIAGRRDHGCRRWCHILVRCLVLRV